MLLFSLGVVVGVFSTIASIVALSWYVTKNPDKFA